MDHYLKEINYFLFYHWTKMIMNEVKEKVIDNKCKCLTYQIKEYTISLHFWKNLVIEQQITNRQTGEILYYIHFEFINFLQAKRFIEECFNFIDHSIGHKKVLVVCSCGITSTFIVDQLQEISKQLDLNYEFKATSQHEVKEIFNTYDCICLAPQIAYLKAKLSKEVNKPIIVIETASYATNNHLLFLALLEETIKKENMKHEENIISLQYGNVNKFISR